MTNLYNIGKYNFYRVLYNNIKHPCFFKNNCITEVLDYFQVYLCCSNINYLSQ